MATQSSPPDSIHTHPGGRRDAATHLSPPGEECEDDEQDSLVNGRPFWETRFLQILQHDPMDRLTQNYASYAMFKRAGQKYQEKTAALRSKAKEEDKRARDEVYRLKGTGLWKLARDTTGNSKTKPLEAVKRQQVGPQGQRSGTIALRPKEIDMIIRKSYGAIYSGNSADHEKLLGDYIKDYGRFVFVAEQPTMMELTGQDLMASALTAKETAAGIDQCPGDLKLFSKKAFDWIAVLLNMVEAGSGWPQQMKVARAASWPRRWTETWILCHTGSSFCYRPYTACGPGSGSST